MADNSRTVWLRYFSHRVTTPVGTLRTAPMVTTLDVEDTVLTSVHLQIPSGHAGLTGFAMEFAGERFLPWSADDAWISGDDDNTDFDVGLNITGTLNVVTYNEGTFPHEHLFRMAQRYRDIPGAAGAPALTVVA
jgi:hypothetical protein